MRYKAVVMGASAGGFSALSTVLTVLPADFAAPVIIVQHMSPDSDNYVVRTLNGCCRIRVKEADEKEKAVPGGVYIAPPNYHLMIEEDTTLSLSTGKRVRNSRPSIDVLFETAAEAYGTGLIGVILTGSNNDGSRGLSRIKSEGGLAVVQDPETAEADEMPGAAIAMVDVDNILTLSEIGPFLCKIIR